MPTAKQLSAIGAICSRLKVSKDEKEMIVQGFSEGRCTSSKELTVHEALLMLKYLHDRLGDENDKGHMLAKIFSICHELAVLQPTAGWVKYNGQGKRVADGKRFDEWAVKHSYLKKKLDRYTYKELPKLVTQFELYYKHLLSKY
jgi:hypothetical protein